MRESWNVLLMVRAQPVIPPNLYSNVNEHNTNSLGSPGKKCERAPRILLLTEFQVICNLINSCNDFLKQQN